MDPETTTSKDDTNSPSTNENHDVPIPPTIPLESLQSAEQRELMGLVGRLRRAGLSTLLQLPQIAVTGDQSSGKSSVLEALSGIPFPRKENLCTRFATEIIMRPDANMSISSKINPHPDTSEELQTKLKAFSKSIKSVEELPFLFEEATAVMGLDSHKAFSKDVLSIEICGPDVPHLTLVDLPGLIHSANKAQSDEDVNLIQSLVEDYIKEERTIILAVVSAKNDYANQIILKKCRQFDPKGARTLGVITKPDYLRAGSENESNWLGLAQNRDVVFELGWHMLKNRADDQVQWSTAQRNAEERAFFNAGNYRPVPQCAKGIAALRERLSKLLFDHLKRELPALKLELDDMTAQTTKELEALGKSRATPMDQRVYLTELFVSASNLVRMGVEGNYENAFFGQIDTKAAVDSLKNICRLRAVVQYLNMQFAQNMRSKGHRFLIEEDQETKPASKDTKASKLEGQAIINPAMLTKTITRKEAIKWVIQIMQRTRGRELPGTFNPMLVSSLFQDQSAHWEIIARRHINLVASSCCAFVLHVVSQLATPEVETKLLSLTVLPALKAAQKAALNELELLIEDKKRHPITYNHYFTDTLQRLQDARRMDKITEIAKNATVNVSQKSFSPGPGYENIDYINPDKFNKAIQSSMSRNMDEVAAEQALDAHDAYYKDERKYFIGVITKQAVERHLLASLAEILSPNVLACYVDREIQFLAAESSDVAQTREYLKNKKTMLEEGQDAFVVAMEEHV